MNTRHMFLIEDDSATNMLYKKALEVSDLIVNSQPTIVNTAIEKAPSDC